MKIVTFLLLLEIFSFVSSFDFQNPHQDGVAYDDTDSQLQITVDENNSGGKITIAAIVEVQGDPRIMPMFGNDIIGPEIQQENNQYVLKVNQLDYESLVKNGSGTSFQLMIIETTSKFLTVNIKNIDDESPSLQFLSTICEMEEESEIDVNNSACIFEVSDPDGWLGSMTFTVTVQDWSDIFELKYQTIPDDNLEKTNVYLVPSGETLDYETRQTYRLAIEAEDQAGHSISHKLAVTVSVTDKPPVWTVLPSVKHVDEETETSFQIVAIDPDQNSPKELYYYLTSYSSFVNIDMETGNVSVDKINREFGFTSIPLTTLVRFRDPFSYFSTEGYIQLLIDDIDDNIPKINKIQDSLNIPLPQNSNKAFLMNIEIQDDDVDAENSAYYIDLKTTDDLRSALDVSPKRGSGKTTVALTIDTAELNRNLPHLDSFGIELWTRGVKTPENEDTWPIVVILEKQGDSSGENIGVNWMIITILMFAMMIHIGNLR